MKKLVVGILAHVDAGKTTLSEALLYRSGALRRLGRVDHRDAFLDTETLERERGITIFAKEARLTLPDAELQLLDTPGHVDFSAEMERTLRVLDYAVLVVSGTDGVQAHTRTLWRLLGRCGVPVFLFVNKMDLAGTDRAALLAGLRRLLDDGCTAFDGPPEEICEQAALCGEDILNTYLETGSVPDETLVGLIAARRLFPVWFGSALKLTGVDEFLAGLQRWTREPDRPEAFGARVYQISRDAQGARLTHLKVTGGVLRVKSPLTNRRPGLPDEQVWEEKPDQLRLYSGARFQTADTAEAGTICAVTGLRFTRPGEGLGFEGEAAAPALEPVLTYQVLLPEGCDPHGALEKLRLLEEEDPQLHVTWSEPLRQIHMQLMGEVQLEVLRRLIADRFGLDVSFGAGSVVYRETIAGPVEGVGHFEPLRHYAEVHLLLEPGERGSGVTLATVCPEDSLAGSWQRLVLTHLAEREFPGVLTGSPLTDVKITLLSGRAHVKHTEGGDFRQATYRAVRQGLMQAEVVLLEPWYDFRLELPPDCVGRAMADIQQRSGSVGQPEATGGETVLTGSAPVVAMRGYAAEVAAYTRGRGRLACTLRGYEPCRGQDAVADAIGYDPERDTENPSGSVFCAHGGGFPVPWNEVAQYAHLPCNALAVRRSAPEPPLRTAAPRPVTYESMEAEDRELRAIFERTYGPIRDRSFHTREESRRDEPAPARREINPPDRGPEYLLVDGYNIIFAWDELKTLAEGHLDVARKCLMDILSNYRGFRPCEVILVFDAYRVPNNPGELFRYHNITVVYTKEAQTADSYIEKTTYEIGRQHRVRVATSDNVEQLIVLGHGALRVSADAFRREVEQVEGQIADFLRENNRRSAANSSLREAMARAKETKSQ